MIQTSQIDIEKLKKVDILITSSGYESRADFIGLKIYNKASQKFCLGFENEKEDLIRQKNDESFGKMGFKSLIASSENGYIKILDYLIRVIAVELEKSVDKVTVLIDYSSMTKNWYSYLLLSSCYLEKREKLNLIFSYSHSLYEKNNTKASYNKVVKPLMGYCNLSIPCKPTALIIGLGYESERVYGLKEYFDAEPYFFYSNNNYNPEYSEEVEEAHKNLLKKAKANNIIKYPIYDLPTTSYLLENLCSKLLEKHRVIIAPCGPKPFGLVSMIASLRNNDSIEVWRISAGEVNHKVNRIAEGLITSLEVNFSN